MAFLGDGFTPHKFDSGEREYQGKLKAAVAQHGNRNPHVSGLGEAPSNFSQSDNQGSMFNSVLRDPMNQTGSYALQTSSTEVPSMSPEDNARNQLGEQQLGQRMAMGYMPNKNNHRQVYGGRSNG